MFAAISEAVMGVVKPVLDKFVPDAKDKLEAENAIWQSLSQANLQQIEVNKIEAGNTNLFVSGWRPFIGWVCGASLAYAVIGNDLLNWVGQIVTMYSAKTFPPFPEPDLTLTFELLMGMLGLGGMRTYEKLKGVAR